MKLIRKSFLTCIAVFFCLLLSGCGLSNEERLELGNEQLQLKYDDSFTVLEVETTSTANMYLLKYTVQSEKYPEEPVQIYLNGGVWDVEEITVKDNYVALKYANETYAFIEENVSKICNEFKIIYDVPWVGIEDLNKNSTFEELLKNDDMSIGFELVLKESEYNDKELLFEKCNSIYDLLTEYNVDITIYMYLLEDSKYTDCPSGYLTHENIMEYYFSEEEDERESVLYMFTNNSNNEKTYYWKGRFEEEITD